MTEAQQHAGPMLTAALDAWDNGLCVVRAHTDGTKRPLGEWKQYQSARPSREQVANWFANEHPGMGVICGAVSGDLEMFELEGRFCTDIGTRAFSEAMKAAGLELLLHRLVNGFMTVSPSDGRHFLYRCEGAIDGNTKLARRPATPQELAANPDDRIKVMIETRGEGGFVVLPPSHGTTHPTGRSWVRRNGSFAAIPTITVEEREALFAVARSFDTIPAPPRQTVSNAQKATIAPCVPRTGESWMDAIVRHLEATWSTRALLEHYGWTYSHDDRHGRQLMTRPGKDEGVSGSINERGRLMVFSTSTPFDAPGGRMAPTYDRLGIIAAYEHQGDRIAAARDIAQRAGILGAPADVFGAAAPPANIDPATGEIIDPDDDFWHARPYLTHIRDAARSRLVGPWAALGATLARVAAWTPPSTCVPAIIGSRVPLTSFFALYGNSGGGKSAAMEMSADLLPGPPAGRAGPLQLGTGEGLAEAFMEMVEETVDGKKRLVKRQARMGVLFNLDEGGALKEMNARKGSTIMQVLRTAWTGGDPGAANASAETRRHLARGSYACALVSGWQTNAAEFLFGDMDGGTPQRFVWFSCDDTGAGLGWDWPGEIRVTWPIVSTHPDPLEVCDEVRQEITEHRIAKLRGEVTENPLDAHRNLAKLKIAGLLAIMDDRHDINPDDWQLAERIMRHSDGIRDYLLAEHRRRAQAADEAVAKRQAARELVVAETVTDRALMNGARAAWRAASKAAESGGRASLRDISRAVSSRDRKYASTTEVVAKAAELAWIEGDDEHGYTPGKARPT